jgi:hypothetical protein
MTYDLIGRDLAFSTRNSSIAIEDGSHCRSGAVGHRGTGDYSTRVSIRLENRSRGTCINRWRGVVRISQQNRHIPTMGSVILLLLPKFLLSLRWVDAGISALGPQWLNFAGVPTLEGLSVLGCLRQFVRSRVQLKAGSDAPAGTFTQFRANAIQVASTRSQKHIPDSLTSETSSKLHPAFYVPYFGVITNRLPVESDSAIQELYP